MADVKTIVTGIAILTGGASLIGTIGDHYVNTTRMQDKIAALEGTVDAATVTNIKDRLAATETLDKGFRDEMNGIHQRENGLADGLRDARAETAQARTEISGKLELINSNVAHIKDAVDEVKNLQHKNPQSLNGTSQ